MSGIGIALASGRSDVAAGLSLGAVLGMAPVPGGLLEVLVDDGIVEITVIAPAAYAGTYSVDTADLAAGPVSIVPPTISGTGAVGETLSQTGTGLWVYEGSAPIVSLQWQADTLGNRVFADLSGETGASFVVGPSEDGDGLRAVETAFQSGVGSRSAASDWIQVGVGSSFGVSSVSAPHSASTFFDGVDTWQVYEITGSGTIEFAGVTDIEYLLVAGGGGGGHVNSRPGGGGGAGGLIEGTTVVGGSATLIVGAGGTAGISSVIDTQNGGDTSAFGLTAIGGGGGASGGFSVSGRLGGSGGGATGWGNAPSDSGSGTPGQGNDGGYKSVSVQPAGGAGGGAGGSPPGGSNDSNVENGPGLTRDITGSPVLYAPGGLSRTTTGSALPVAASAGAGGNAAYGSGTVAANGAAGVIILRYRL